MGSSEPATADDISGLIAIANRLRTVRTACGQFMRMHSIHCAAKLLHAVLAEPADAPALRLSPVSRLDDLQR